MELIKVYDHLSCFGMGTLIITGWKDENHYFYQWFLHFESGAPPLEVSQAMKTEIENWTSFRSSYGESNEEEIMEAFMEEGYRIAKANLFGVLVDRAKPEIVMPDIDFKEGGNVIGAIMYLRGKFPAYLQKMENQAYQEKIKGLIKIAN